MSKKKKPPKTPPPRPPQRPPWTDRIVTKSPADKEPTPMDERKQFLSTIMASRDASPDEPTMVVSTASPDREGDRVVPEGGDFAAFRRNPTLLWCHDRQALPIGAATGLEVLPEQGLKMKFRWLDGDPFADRVRNAWSQGIVRAASVGFIPRRSERNVFGGRDFLEWELLEVSLCPVPANPEAVRALQKLQLFGAASRHADEDDDDLVTIIDDGPSDRQLLREALRGPGEDWVAVPTREEVRAALREALRKLAEPYIRDAIMRTTGRVD